MRHRRNRSRRHVLVSVLQLDDEAGDGTAGRRAQDRQGAEKLAERAYRLDADDERDAYQADYEPQGLDAVYLRAAVEERGEENATNIGVEERSTPARPEGTESSPVEIRMNGAAIASAPSRIACRGRRTMSQIAARASPLGRALSPGARPPR